MTAGLPDTRSGGSTFHRRILAALLITTIAVAPARAQHAASPEIETPPPAELKDAMTTIDSSVIDAASQALVDTPRVNTTTPALSAKPVVTDQPPAASIDQTIYKGVVGNILEAMPLDPDQRVQLQRGNAIINNTFTGRSLALLLGIASPPLMIAGFIWGIWSAINIKPAEANTRTALAPSQPPIKAEQSALAAEAVQAPRSGDSPAADPDHVAAQSLD
jgi:hypothetical protein